jgi:hypothetical protein
VTHFLHGLLLRFNNTNLTVHMKLLEHAKIVRGAELCQVYRFCFSIIILIKTTRRRRIEEGGPWYLVPV